MPGESSLGGAPLGGESELGQEIESPSATTTSVGGWYGLLNIYNEGQAIIRDERTRQPVACPNDGEPLKSGPHGQLYCPWDGWPNETA